MTAPTPLSPEQLDQLAARLLAAVAETATAENELKLYTPAEAAHLLGKSEDWIFVQTRAGAIPHCRLGKSVMFRSAHIRAIAAQYEIDPARRPRRRSAA
jgi:hypothetical protein